MTVAQSTSKYDMRHNPVYQVDWSAEASGKRVSATKRRVRFRFGFSDPAAIEAGHSGMNCRGEEHEVVLVWSLTSGKQLVIADGKEVHFSLGKRTETRFETSWTMSGGHILKVVAHMTPPVFADPTGFRQFDLFLDGFSFHDMPKIYELGTRSSLAVTTADAQNYNNMEKSEYSPTSVAYENSYYANDGCQYYKPSGREEATDLEPEYGRRRSTASQFATPPKTKTPYQSESSPEQSTVATAESTVVDLLAGPVSTANNNLMITPEPQQQLTVQTVQDEFAPREDIPETPTFQNVANEILSAYTPTSEEAAAASNDVLALANQAYNPEQPNQQPQQYHQYQSPQKSSAVSQYQQHQVETYNYNNSPTVECQTPSSPVAEESSPNTLRPTMEPLSLEEMERRERPPMSEMEKAMKDLVNLSDLQETLETPEQLKSKARQQQNQTRRSKPLPATVPEWHLGKNASLGAIKENAPQKTPTKDVMRTHAFDPAAAQAGMMVCYGATTLPPTSGFGAGVHASHYGQQVPQLQPAYACH